MIQDTARREQSYLPHLSEEGYGIDRYITISVIILLCTGASVFGTR